MTRLETQIKSKGLFGRVLRTYNDTQSAHTGFCSCMGPRCECEENAHSEAISEVCNLLDANGIPAEYPDVDALISNLGV